jgi:hypothetical protein
VSNKSWIIYVFALLYMGSLMYGWLGPRELVTTGDYFAQSALILTALGLYNTEPPRSDPTTDRLNERGRSDAMTILVIGVLILAAIYFASRIF